MHDLQTLENGGYRDSGLTQLKLSCPLTAFPEEILGLGDTLEQLDLSGTGLSSLPANLSSSLPNLKIALFSNCNFRVFPKELASCPKLETVAFRSNGMEEIPEDALPPRLRCLILTNNHLTSLPSSIGRCQSLQKCMLTSNQLRDLPSEMASCKQLSLLRLSSNRFSALPPWLFTLPELAFLSFASNPCASPTSNGGHAPRGLTSIAWSDLEEQQPLSSGTSQGLWHQSPHYAEDVAIKLFRSSPASDNDDGSPADEMAACLAAGAHESLITMLGRIHGHPEEEDEAGLYHGGIVTQLIPEEYIPLGSTPPPTAETCAPDLPPPPSSPPQRQPQEDDQDQAQPTQTSISQPQPPQPQSHHAENENENETQIDIPTALQTLTGLAGSLSHLHARGIAHGAISPSAILASRADAHALLTGFGAATLYDAAAAEAGWAQGMEKVEVRAFAAVVECVLALAGVDVRGGERMGEGGGGGDGEGEGQGVVRGLCELWGRCVDGKVRDRPAFEEVVEVLEGLMGWRGIMRIPDVVPT